MQSLQIVKYNLYWIVLSFFLYLGALRALIPWSLCLVVALYLARKLTKDGVDSHSSVTIVQIVELSYMLLSILGLIIVLDNRNNFNADFGYASDDSNFFYTIEQSAQGGEPYERGFFELFVSIFGRFLNIIYQTPFELLDILPINWALTAMCVGLSAQLARTVSKKQLPLGLLLAGTIGNFVFVDSTVRLYRDSFALLFVLLSMNMATQNNMIHATVCSVLAGIVRGANGMLSLFFVGIHRLGLKMRTAVRYYLIFIVSGALVVIFVIQPFSRFILTGASDYSKSERYRRNFVDMSVEEQLKMRVENISFTRKAGSISSMAYDKGGIVGTLTNVAVTMFFPISFYPLVMSAKYNSLYGSLYIEDGFFIFNIVEWIMVLCWIVVIPLLCIGIWKAFSGNRMQNGIFLYYLAAVLLVAIVSGQIRHACIFIIINPVLMALGYQHIQINRHAAIIHSRIRVLVIVGIVVINIMKIYHLSYLS